MNDLTVIKDKYGEKMMHFCRKNFSTILEDDGRLFELLSAHFTYSRNLYNDLVVNDKLQQFKNYIYSLLDDKKVLVDSDSSVIELLDNAGYVLYECKTEEDINKFIKYYVPNEALCTFRGNRLDECFVFFAVSKNVDKIKRVDYSYPNRQDIYGTSVISIQFTKGEFNTLSIMNRYNHSVVNPDATYSNNLENIMPGLTRSFEKEFNLKISQNSIGGFEIPGYVMANDGKYYKYNYKINDVYYCVDNIIIDNYEVIKDYKDKEKYIVIDYFVIDLVKKKISLYDISINDSFVSGLENIRKIDIVKDNNRKILTIFLNNDDRAIIVIDKYNRIIGYKNDNLLEYGNNYLRFNKYLERIDTINVKKVGDNCLATNNILKEIRIPNVLEIGNDFCLENRVLRYIDVSKVVLVKDNFCKYNEKLEKLVVSNMIKCGNCFVMKNKIIKVVDVSNLEYAGDYFMQYNLGLEEFIASKLKYVGSWVLTANRTIKKIDLSSLLEVKDNFMASNNSIEILIVSSLRNAGNNFFFSSRILKKIYLDSIENFGNKAFYYNNSVEYLYVPNLLSVGKYFFSSHDTLRVKDDLVKKKVKK